MSWVPKKGQPSRPGGQFIKDLTRPPLKINRRAQRTSGFGEAMKGPAFWSDTSKVQREVPAPPPHQWEKQEPEPAPPGLLGNVGWWPIAAFALAAAALLLFFILVSFIGAFVREVDYMNAAISRMQRWEDRLKRAVKHEAGDRALYCKVCEEPWIQWGHTCYLRTSEAMPWNKCTAHCQEYIGSLLIGSTEGEMEFLMMESHKWFIIEDSRRIPEQYWIGLKYNVTQKTWHWADGENLHLRLPGLQNWRSSAADVCVLMGSGSTVPKGCNEANHCLCKRLLD